MSLFLVKFIHTVIWAFFVACILGIPVSAIYESYRVAAWLSLIVLVEVAVLLFNKWSCPLTAVAARYTRDRAPNFDIYLPQWLARYNKVVFGVLYLGGVCFALVKWAASHG